MADRASTGYHEHRPPPGLEDLVECFWTRVDPPGDGVVTHRVLPDGCIDVLFEPAGGLRVVGAMTRPLIVRTGGATDYVAARFRPGGALPLFGRVPLSEWTDRALPVADLWSDGAEVEDRIGSADPSRRHRLLVAELAMRIGGDRRRDPTVAAAVAALESGSPPSVHELAAALGVTRQHLTRRVTAATGLGPKQLARIARMRRCLGRLRDGRGSLAAAAAASGYADQAHRSAEFRVLTGRTPGSFFTRRRRAAGADCPA